MRFLFPHMKFFAKIVLLSILVFFCQTAIAQMSDRVDTLLLSGLPCKGLFIITDHQGNTYRTVQIGSQCWMAENMRCTTSPTGRRWYINPSFTSRTPIFSPYVKEHRVEQYGNLYNWAAAMDIDESNYKKASSDRYHRGICPVGWHLPTADEWSVLFNTLQGTRKAGSLMKCPSSLWESQAVTLDKECGFSAMPAGTFTEEGLVNLGFNAQFWSATSFDRNMAWYCGVYSYNNNSENNLDYKCYGCSVRCLRDE